MICLFKCHEDNENFWFSVYHLCRSICFVGKVWLGRFLGSRWVFGCWESVELRATYLQVSFLNKSEECHQRKTWNCQRCGSVAFPNFCGGIFSEKCVRTNSRILHQIVKSVILKKCPEQNLTTLRYISLGGIWFLLCW